MGEAPSNRSGITLVHLPHGRGTPIEHSSEDPRFPDLPAA